MDYVPSQSDELDKWREVTMVYGAAIREIETKMQILNDEFALNHKYNPIEHIKTRLKKSESICDKLRKDGYDTTIENMVKYVNDIAGIRVICSFTSDIYRLADIITNQTDIEVISIKDYYKSPKPSGYQSYHMIVKVPVFLTDKVVDVKAEIQIRTVAMDFWATLEHKIRYKLKENAPRHIQQSLMECAKMVSALDDEMLCLNEEITRFIDMMDDNGKNKP